MTTLELRSSLLAEVSNILGSDALTREAIQALKNVWDNRAKIEQQEKERQALLANLKQAFHELNEVKAGRLQLMSEEDFLKELKTMQEEGGKE